MLFAADSGAGLMPAILAIVSIVIGAGLTVITNYLSNRATFDQRLRLEKEYELYSELWDKLFELRRMLGPLVGPLGDMPDREEHVLAAFNDFQAIVRRSEPFMCATVYEPAREIITRARDIVHNVGEQTEIGEMRHDRLNLETDERLADTQMQLDEQSAASLKRIEELFQQVSKAIKRRVRP